MTTAFASADGPVTTILNGENDMEDQLQILVRAETSTTSIVIQTEGALTTQTVGSSLRAVARAALLQGCTGVYLDLRNLERIEPEAWKALDEYVQAFGRQPPIRLVGSWSPSGLIAAEQAEQLRPPPHTRPKKSRRQATPKSPAQ